MSRPAEPAALADEGGGVDAASPAQPEGGEQEGGEQEGGEQEGVEQEGGEPEGGEQEGGEQEGGDPEGGEPEGVEPEGAEPEGGDPEGGDPEGGDPEGGDPEADQGSSERRALPRGVAEVRPRCGESADLGRSARTVLLRALCLGSLVALAFCVVVYLGPSALDVEGGLTSAALGAAVGLFAIGVPSGIECWLATWGEARRARGFLLLYLGSLLGWLASGVQFGYLHYVREGRELSEALVLSVQAALEASPPLLAFHVLLPVALALASLRRLRWVIPGRGGAWRWVYVGLLVGMLGGYWVPAPWGRLLHVPLIVAALAVVLTLAYVAIQALQIRLRPEDALEGEELVPGAVVEAGEPPTWGERLIMGGDTNMLVGSAVWLGLGFLWARLGGHSALVIACTLLCWYVHLTLASNLPSMALARGRPGRALALARYYLAGQARGRSAAQARRVRLYREIEVRALLALGRSEEALRYLPQALSETLEGLPEVMARVRLATALVTAGFPELCLKVLGPVPRERTRTGAELHADSLESIALNALDRSQEAYEKAEPLLGHPMAARGKVQAVLLNNLAVYQARLELDLDLAQARAEEAGSLLPALGQTRSTLGAVLLAKGQAEAARPLLEKGFESVITPQSRTWLAERLGRCYLDLGEAELAREAYAQSVASGPESESGRAAALALATELTSESTPNDSLPPASP